MIKIASSTDHGTVFHSGSYCFRFYYDSSYTPQYLISPELENSTTGIDVSFYYTCNNGSDKVKFKVGYSTTNAEIGSFTFGDEIVVTKDADWHLYSNSFTTGTKYIAIQFTATDYRLFIDDVSIEISETYKRPKSLAVSSLTASSATLSWTNGDDESAWQIAYSTKEDFNPDTEGTKVSVTKNPYTLTGLTDNVTYYAYVRSNYDGNYSAWSNKVDFKPYVKLLLNDGSSTNAYVPVPNYTNYASTGSQFVIPSANLTSMQNRKITKLTFYATTSSINWTNATFDVYLDEAETPTYASSGTLKDWGTKVVSDKGFTVNEGELAIVFDAPFLYKTGNLLIGIEKVSSTSGNVLSTWYGISETSYTSTYFSKYGDASITYYSPQTFSPKVTIESVSPTIPVTLGTNGYTTFACPRPLDLTAANLPTGLKAYKAAVDGDKVKFTEINQAVPANTGMLLEGEAGETYNIPVAESGTAPEGNEFLVNSAGGTFAATEGYTYFGMKKATSASDAIVFATFVPSTVAIPTNKAYLKVLTSSLPSAARQLVCTFDDDTTTGIKAVGDMQQTQGSYYNLAGQRVSKPGKGLYVVDGKKVIVK